MKKEMYESPQVEVILVEIEKGFAISQAGVGFDSVEDGGSGF